MRKVAGLYVGAGTSAMYIGLGFRPDWVKIRNIDQAAQEEVEWNIHMIRDTVAAEGILRSTIGADDTGLTVLTFGNGIEPYYGGDLIATASANYVMPANMVDGYRGNMAGKGSGDEVDTWTLDTAGTPSGHFNAPINSTYVNEGSFIDILETSSGLLKRVALTALSNDGDATDDVTISHAVGSGKVRFIGYRYGFVNTPAGQKMPEGIKISDTTYVNVSAQKCLIEAGTFDANF